jgi:integrase/recombinase XerD
LHSEGRAVSGPIITIFVRHKPACKWHGDEFTKNCRCRKHLRWSLGGKQFRKQAGTRSWAEAEEAKARLAAQLSGDDDAPVVREDKQTIRGAVEVFMEAKRIRKTTAEAVRRYEIEMNRFADFCEKQNVFVVAAINMLLLLKYKGTWPTFYPSSTTQMIVQKRLRGFLRFCKDAGWLNHLPKLEPVAVTAPPTLPLTDKEYTRLLAVAKGRTRAIILLMRWSGLAVRDASCLPSDGIVLSSSGIYRVMTARQKTGVYVYVPIRSDVAEEILASSLSVTHKGEDHEYLFWRKRKCAARSFTIMVGTEISAAFKAAKIRSQGHMVSHRLRDTFAVDLLSKGVPMEDVSKMLGHESINTTEKHYAQWAKGRQDRVDALVTGTWVNQ